MRAVAPLGLDVASDDLSDGEINSRFRGCGRNLRIDDLRNLSACKEKFACAKKIWIPHGHCFKHDKGQEGKH